MSSFEEDASQKIYREKEAFRREMDKATSEFECEKDKFEKEILSLRKLLNSTHPFCDVAIMKADVEMLVFHESANYLRYKHHPARTAAEEVRRMKRISSQILVESKKIEYKYEYILSAFPEIEEYVNNDQDLISVGEQLSYAELDDVRDKRRDYLTSDEYSQLSDTERSQLALDRYVREIKKNRWQIGRDYEMSCAFQLRRQGYSVDMHGIKYKRADLGRDLIAVKYNGAEKEILVVQCKNWSHNRIIHENVVMQLVGTTIEFRITNGDLPNQAIIPVLMIPAHSVLSDIAIQFAEKLKVRIERMDSIEFPRIKCNINGGSKIYHLPFDQQYDRTEIKLKGECYAYTAAEAESKGFRRAMRHCFT